MARNDPTGPLSVLGRATRLLDCFGADHPVRSLASLTRETGLPRSTVYRLADELCELGWLEKTRAGYQVGMRVFELGALAPLQRTLAEVARPFMQDVQEATGARVHLAVLDGSEVVYVEILQSKAVPAMASRRGGRLPAHATGVGKAILAFSEPSAVARVLAAGLPRLTPRTISTPGAFNRELAVIREEGVAYDREENRLGVLCAAAPIFGADGRVAAAMSISGFDRRVMPRMGPAVKTATLALSRTLAAQP